ncbi:MAG TPA: PQQ-binding-like beta-propeller repeat protein [Pirellulales bacterium]|nr:PQQ-binding-like beta-propeller repeat protein [Pirellulales bacterium]
MFLVSVAAGIVACYPSWVAVAAEPGDAPDTATPAWDEWPQFGGSPARNNVRFAQHLPDDWDVGEIDATAGEWKPGSGRNVRWAARLGTVTHGSPVVSGGKVFIGANNGGGRLARFPATVDLGCLLCFRERDGQFLWQYSAQKLPTGRANDWPLTGVCSTPLVEGQRLWFVSNRCEVVCLDTEGFLDGENDGPVRENELPDEADVIWTFDMRQRLGVWPHNMANCSLTSAGRLLFVCTSNGVGEGHTKIVAPGAPSFLCLDKHTGEVVWKDNSPGENILHGQWSSPAYAVVEGQPQVVFGGGDGWLYAFDPLGDGHGGAKLLWKFDCNPKTMRHHIAGRSRRNHVIAVPLIHDGLVYVAVGEDPEHGEGEGHLWCIDPRRRGDVSSALAALVQDHNHIVPPRRLQAVIEEAGEVAIDNPNSAAVWHYAEQDWDGDGRIAEFEERMHRTCSTAAIKDGLLVVPDFSGLVHCIDATTGRVHWTYDVFAAVWSSPLIADDRIYVGDEEGKITVFKRSDKRVVLGQIDFGQTIYSTPVAAGGVLYVATKTHLFAISDEP